MEEEKRFLRPRKDGAKSGVLKILEGELCMQVIVTLQICMSFVLYLWVKHGWFKKSFVKSVSLALTVTKSLNVIQEVHSLGGTQGIMQ